MLLRAAVTLYFSVIVFAVSDGASFVHMFCRLWTVLYIPRWEDITHLLYNQLEDIVSICMYLNLACNISHMIDSMSTYETYRFYFYTRNIWLWSVFILTLYVWRLFSCFFGGGDK